jgi:hypothetical protein
MEEVCIVHAIHLHSALVGGLPTDIVGLGAGTLYSESMHQVPNKLVNNACMMSGIQLWLDHGKKSKIVVPRC